MKGTLVTSVAQSHVSLPAYNTTHHTILATAACQIVLNKKTINIYNTGKMELVGGHQGKLNSHAT